MAIIQQFFHLQQLSQGIELQINKVKSFVDLGHHQEEQLIGVRSEPDQWQIVSFKDRNIQKWKFEAIKAKPIFIDHEHNFALFYTENTLTAISLNDRTQQTSFNIPFKPKLAVTLKPHIDATLLIGLGKVTNHMLFMNEQRQPLPHSQSLNALLQPYSAILIVANDEYSNIVIAVQLKNQIQVLVVGIENAEQQRKQFSIIQSIKGLFTVSDAIDLLHLQRKKLVVCYNGSKIKIIDLETMQQLNLKHSFKIFKGKQLMMLDERKLVIKDQTGEIYIIDTLDESQNKINSLNHTSENLCILNTNNLLISEDLNISKIIPEQVEDALIKLLDCDTYTALQIMRSTGFGKQLYLKYQFSKSGCNDMKVMHEYLKDSNENGEELIEILKSNSNIDIDVFELVLSEALIRWKNKQPFLQIKQRLQTFKMLEKLRNKRVASLNDFCFNLTITQIISQVIQSHDLSPHGLQDSVALLFKELDVEIALNYEVCIGILPFEFFEPSFMLKYLPPGSSQPNNFWQLYEQITQSMTINEQSLYKKICQEYIDDVFQPGKALIILQEAIQKRGVRGLTHLAMRAVDKIFFHNSESSLKSKINGREESIQQDLSFIQHYFEKSKWIFVIENTFYKNYISQINEVIQQFIGELKSDFALKFLVSLVQYSSEQLLFLRDQDLCQLTLNIIYDTDSYNFKHIDLFQRLYQLLQELSLSTNQSSFLRNYLNFHIKLQNEYLYSIELSFKQLLQIQSAQDPSSIDVISKIITILNQMLDFKIKKAKNVKEQVKAFSQQDQQSTVWIACLQELLGFKDAISPLSQVDVYQLFIKRLLDNRVTSSIEQLIESQLFPIEQLQKTILKNLQDQLNVCESENFYQVAQTSKQFLELFQNYTDNIDIQTELKLLELCFYFKQNKILIGQLPNTQIRSDFMQNRLIDRCLQIHGFSKYPQSFEILIEIQKLIDETQLSNVFVKILRHLNQIKVFENVDQKPAYLQKMMQQIIINRYYSKNKNVDFSWIDEDGITNILYKIALISGDDPAFKKDLLKFLINNSEKKGDIFYFICRELIPPRAQPSILPNLGQELKFVLSHNLVSKAKHLLLVNFGQKNQSQDVFCSMLESIPELTYAEVKLLGCIMNQDSQILKSLKGIDNQEIARFIRDPESYQNHIQSISRQKVVKVALPQTEKEETNEEFQDALDQAPIPIKDLMASQEVIDAEMIIDMEYTDWNQNIDIEKIILDMKSQKITEVTSIALQAILDKLGIEEKNNSQMIELSHLNLNLNILLIAKDLKDPINHFDSILKEKDSSLVFNLKALVSDFNLYKLLIALEPINEQYPILVAICLYINKLDLVEKNQNLLERQNPKKIEQTLYSTLSKDEIEEIIENNEIIEPIIQKINSMYSKKGIRQDLLKAVMIE